MSPVHTVTRERGTQGVRVLIPALRRLDLAGVGPALVNTSRER